MINPNNEETVILSSEEYAVIDAVAPYEAGKGITAQEALDKARKRTKAWMQATEPTAIGA